MVSFDDAKEVANQIVHSVNPVLVTLFGSVARNQIGNDLDLLIVVEDNQYNKKRTNSLIQQSLNSYHRKFDIETFILSTSQYINQTRSGDPFMNAILKEGRVLFMTNYLNNWMQQAEEELKTARYLLEGNFYRSACYHSEQGIEKYLKAKLLEKGWDLEKSHSIRRLLAISADYGLHYDLGEDSITFVDSIYRGRHPTESGLLPQGEPDLEDAIVAIKIAESLIKKRIE